MRLQQTTFASQMLPTRMMMIKGLLLAFSLLPSFHAFTNPSSKIILLNNGNDASPSIQLMCDNVTDGGTIIGNEEGCPNPVFDPSVITSDILPTGGTGNLEYIWISSTDDPSSPNAQWTPIVGSTSAAYDPEPISVTTYYRRCARRDGCIEYIGESNIIVKTVNCCDNITDGGMLCCDQVGCGPGFDPDTIQSSLLATGGSGDIEYQWYFSTTDSIFNNNWAAINGSNSAIYNPDELDQTTWFVRCARRSGCDDFSGKSNVIKITVLQSPVLTATTDGEILCFGDETVDIDLTVTGNGPYIHNWNDGFNFFEDLNDVSAGTYQVVVTDDNDCSASLEVIVNGPDSLFLITEVEDIGCEGGATGSAKVTIGGGTPGYTVQWDDTAMQTSTTANNLTAGMYGVTVTDMIGCQLSAVVEIVEAVPFTYDLSVNRETCFGFGDGSASVANIMGGTPPYSILWSDANNQTTQIANNLTPNTYYVTISDSGNCSMIDSVTVANGSTINPNLFATNVECAGGNDGTASVFEVVGGTAPYTYNWNDINTMTSSINDLPAGTYIVTVSDLDGCTGIDSVAVMDGAMLNISLDGSAESCLGSNDGTARVISAAGGPGPFLYEWSNGENASTINNLTPGTYEVTVTNGDGCSNTASYTVAAGNPLTVSLSKNDIPCGGGDVGQAFALVTGGTPPYTYQWDDPNQQTVDLISNLAAGNYSVTATDATGCTGEGAINIIAPGDIAFSIDITNISCTGVADGAATVNILSGNINDLTFQWNDANNSTSANVTGLEAGDYQVSITSADGCMDIGMVTITEPAVMSLQFDITQLTCSDAANGSAQVSVSGGVMPYTYQWDDPNNSTTNQINNLAAGIYSLTVVDANGCVILGGVEIDATPGLAIDESVTDENCIGSNDGAIDLIVTGGSGNYSFLWNDTNNSTSQNLDNLSAGSYTVTVSDDNGCSATTDVNVEIVSSLAIQVSETNVSCPEGNDGFISLNITGGTAPISIQWDDSNNSTTETLSNLSAGFYNYTITDGNGCTAMGTAEIFEPAPLALSFTKVDLLCETDTNGAATVTVNGFSAPYTYSWNDPTNQTTATATNLGFGSYTVTVTDNNNCTTTGEVNIIATSDLSVVAASISPSCFGESDGQAVATGFNGLPPYSFAWNTGDNSQTIDNQPAGTYRVTITDGNGCTGEDYTEIINPPTLTCATEIIQNISNFDADNGSALAKAEGGTGSYSYSWSDGQNTAVANNLVAGTYTVTITDENNCSCQTQATLTNPAKIGNFIWVDTNENGIQDDNEFGLSSVIITLTGTTADDVTVTKTTITNDFGNYAFDDLEAGTYQIHFGLPSTYVYAQNDAGSDDVDSDADPVTGNSGSITVQPGECNNTVDAGYFQYDEKVNLGDFVWFDGNRNGVQDPWESGVQGISVRLLTASNNGIVGSTTTNFLGFYEFTDVVPGNYRIEFVKTTLPAGYAFSPQDEGIDDQIDSDVDTLTGLTNMFQIFPFTADNLSIDAGVFQKCENVTSGGTITGQEDVCGIGGDPAPITNVTVPSGGFGDAEYLWLQSFVPIYNGMGDPNWTPIPNSNAPNYDPGPITQTTYFIRCARRECCTDYIGESNIIAKNLKEAPLANIEPGPNIACIGELIDFAATFAGAGTTYFWNFGDNAIPQTEDSRVVNDVEWTTAGIKTVSLTVTRFDCSITVTKSITIVDCIAPLIVFDNFNVTTNNSQNFLVWTVDNNQKEGRFYIQYSDDGEAYEIISILQNDPSQREFQFVDEQARLGENYYQIIFDDLTGNHIATDVQMTYMESEAIADVRFYPNPFQQNGTIEVMELQENPIDIIISNGYGQVYSETQLTAQSKRTAISLDHLPAGMYFITYRQKGRRDRVERIMKAER